MPSTDLVLEVCVDSLESVEKVIDIVQQGSNRFEVCSNLINGGGLTPSIGLIKAILKRYPQARLMAMIRPRIGDFVYSETELEVMEQDIREFKAAGVMGVVFGCLTARSRVDVPACQRLATAARPLQITFHRAIDTLSESNTHEHFRNIASINGVTRILSSGGARIAAEGWWTLESLASLSRSNGSISILPGSGINDANVTKLLDAPLGFTEIHLTGSKKDRSTIHSKAAVTGAQLGFGSDEKWLLDRRRIEAVWKVMQDRMANA